MKETSKCFQFRKERGDFDKYLRGRGIDIGSGDDLLQLPDGPTVASWDITQGDAMLMESCPNDCNDFVYSSHCLEHLTDVPLALKNWVRILKPGGFLYIVVPDFVFYEKCCFPSIFNSDHKNTFSLFFDREDIGRETHYGPWEMQDIFGALGAEIEAWKCEHDGYDFRQRPEIDQTLGNAVAQICFVGRKR